jgi:hypothetical protein
LRFAKTGVLPRRAKDRSAPLFQWAEARRTYGSAQQVAPRQSLAAPRLCVEVLSLRISWRGNPSDDLQKQWRKSGRAVLEKVVATDPVQFLKVVSHVLPREIDATMAVNVNLFAEIEDFNAKYRFALAHIGAEIEHKPEPKLIENGNGHHDDSTTDD